jgi:hypothetical protein
MKKFVDTVRGIEIALGSHRRVMHPPEIAKRQTNRRSTHLRKPRAPAANSPICRWNSAGPVPA